MKETLLKIRLQQRKYPPKSQMYKAANYMLNEWDGKRTSRASDPAFLMALLQLGDAYA